MAALGTIQRQILGLKQMQMIHKSCLQTSATLSFEKTHTNWKVKIALTNANYQKKKRKLEKALRLAEKKGEKIRKPIEEKEVSPTLSREIAAGLRKREKHVYTAEELESQVLLEKDWARYKFKQLWHDQTVMMHLLVAQGKALEALREESEELYQLAIQKDDNFLPYTFKGPVFTPTKSDYFAEDGEYVDNTNYFNDSHSDLDITSSFLLHKKKTK